MSPCCFVLLRLSADRQARTKQNGRGELNPAPYGAGSNSAGGLSCLLSRQAFTSFRKPGLYLPFSRQ
ncbi:MAG: hypothetical protein A3D27_03650 [Omnitrophica WOR_2 bacterium RIFCSPHIGHO2_02_FULL_46_37]|nr:MAG: hypothetical protein A3D27_03650 [Omnitrophica WOR_2 bacterium RIFCSPHIGHO2_02_FULL_46_37]OGX44166.1 MAG: hypothetical protein A3H41_00960 [Omnitrophica WOR_2 bacterium RIFCSPLOWO2_02_FULL_45_28]